MGRAPRAPRRPRRVGASELAQMEVCERRVLLEHRFGKQLSEEQRRALQHAQDVHRKVLQEESRPAQGWIWIRRLIDWIKRWIGWTRPGGGGR